jgi:hypothetical protein
MHAGIQSPGGCFCTPLRHSWIRQTHDFEGCRVWKQLFLSKTVSCRSSPPKLRHLIEIEGPLPPQHVLEKMNDDALVVGKEHLTSRSAVVDFIADLGTSPMSFHKSISVTDARDVELGIGRLFLSGIEGILAIRAERSTTKANMTSFPQSFPVSWRLYLLVSLIRVFWSRASDCDPLASAV